MDDMGQDKTCVKLLTSSILQFTRKKEKLNSLLKQLKKWKMEFQIPIVYTKYDARFAQIWLNNINKVLNICCFKILASGNLF